MKKRTLIKDITSDKEREFYGVCHSDFDNIKITGVEDGESAFKECEHISVRNSYFNLRYPFWHCYDVSLQNSEASEMCRGLFWYSKDVYINKTSIKGVKSLRECEDVIILNSIFTSDEIGWRCKNVSINSSTIEGIYAFFESENLKIDNIEFKGKYSFQYIKNSVISNSFLDTKDAFWHAKNLTVKNATLIGEYLGWYSENLTLINCKIKGTQPLCYCKNLKLVDCEFIDCDLAFEYSEVEGNIIGDIISIKNPLKGYLEIGSCQEFIKDNNYRDNGFYLKTK